MKNQVQFKALSTPPNEGGKGGVGLTYYFSLVGNKIIPYRPDLKEKARALRKKSTSSEVFLWLGIKNRQLGAQFHRLVPMLDYITDFYCHELKLAIEIDGDSHDHESSVKYDAKRQERLEQEGVRFLRFDDLDVKREMPFVLQKISQRIAEIKKER